MKRILFIFAALLTTVIASAANDLVTCTKGSPLELAQEAKAPVFVEFDYSKATIDGKTTKAWLATLNDNLRQKFPEQLTESEDMFRTGLKGKYMVCTGDKSLAKFIFRVILGAYKPGKNSAASFLVTNLIDAASLNATIEVYRPDEKQPFVIFEAKDIPGTGDTYSERRQMAYIVAGQCIADLVKKEAKAAAKKKK